MKNIVLFSSLFLLASGSMSFAATNESGSVKFLDTVRVGSTTLPAGTYKVQWEAGAADAQVKISGHGQDLTVPASIATTARRDEVLTRTDGGAQVVEGFTVKSTSFTIK